MDAVEWHAVERLLRAVFAVHDGSMPEQWEEMDAAADVVEGLRPEEWPEEILIQLSFDVDEGWWTSQIVDFPAAVSQARSPSGAAVNVLAALRDLREEREVA